MSLLDFSVFGGMEGEVKQRALRDPRMAKYAKNTRLWDGSLRAYRAPKHVGNCEDFILDKDLKPVCKTGCAAYAKSPCGSKCLYTLVGGRIAENGRVVGVVRPTQTPVASLVSGDGHDAVIFRVLCLNDEGEYSAPSATSNMLMAEYGAVINLTWDGCRQYRVEALLTQAIQHGKEPGKDPSQWTIVGDYTSPKAVISFKPETWQLTSDGYDPTSYCDPPDLCCFVVTDDGFFVGWKDSMLFTSERHDPSKFPRAAIKNFHSKIIEVVTASGALYVSTEDGMFIVRVQPDKDGSAISIGKTYENVLPIPCTLGIANTGAIYATRYGLYALDERGGTPSSVTSKLVHEEHFEREWMPVAGTIQRGVFYGTTSKDESWHIDFPSNSGDASEYGKLVKLDNLGKHMLAGKDGALYYSSQNETLAFDRGDSYLPAIWESNAFIAKGRTSFSRFKSVGQNIDGVKMTVIADGKEVFTTTIANGKICTLPRCVIGLEFSIRLELPASSQEIIVNRIQLASSVTELAAA